MKTYKAYRRREDGRHEWVDGGILRVRRAGTDQEEGLRAPIAKPLTEDVAPKDILRTVDGILDDKSLHQLQVSGGNLQLPENMVIRWVPGTQRAHHMTYIRSFKQELDSLAEVEISGWKGSLARLRLACSLAAALCLRWYRCSLIYAWQLSQGVQNRQHRSFGEAVAVRRELNLA